MIRIFKDAESGKYLVQTSCLSVDDFVVDLAEAVASMKAEAEDVLGVLENAMPIAFKLAGYKAESVSEQRTLVCGVASPSMADVVVTVGK